MGERERRVLRLGGKLGGVGSRLVGGGLKEKGKV